MCSVADNVDVGRLSSSGLTNMVVSADTIKLPVHFFPCHRP